MNVRLEMMEPRRMAPMDRPAFHTWLNDDQSVYLAFYRREGGYLLRFPDMADFEVASDGEDVRAWPTPEVTTGTLDHLWLNQVLPLALTRQGRLVLHASAVDISGHGVAFLGDSGMGKSTLAASFAVSGTRFLTDDGLLLEDEGGRPIIMPSHPSLRLWQDSEDALVAQSCERAPAVSFTDKARLLADPGFLFRNEPCALSGVYFLDKQDVDTVSIVPMRAGDVLMSYVQNSFLLDIDEREQLARHFDQLARLAAHPIHFRLDYPREYDQLSLVREAIVRHALTLT